MVAFQNHSLPELFQYFISEHFEGIVKLLKRVGIIHIALNKIDFIEQFRDVEICF